MKRDNKSGKHPGGKPKPLPFSGEERAKILSVALDRLVLIDGKVYGLEDETEPESFVDCAAKTASCRANCCAYVFALTQEEVKKGFYKYNTERPYYMAKDADGYCLYLDRATFKCGIHDKRPIRCRKYDCAQDKRASY
jgi:hypothetical protein